MCGEIVFVQSERRENTPQLRGTHWCVMSRQTSVCGPCTRYTCLGQQYIAYPSSKNINNRFPFISWSHASATTPEYTPATMSTSRLTRKSMRKTSCRYFSPSSLKFATTLQPADISERSNVSAASMQARWLIWTKLLWLLPKNFTCMLTKASSIAQNLSRKNNAMQNSNEHLWHGRGKNPCKLLSISSKLAMTCRLVLVKELHGWTYFTCYTIGLHIFLLVCQFTKHTTKICNEAKVEPSELTTAIAITKRQTLLWGSDLVFHFILVLLHIDDSRSSPFIFALCENMQINMQVLVAKLGIESVFFYRTLPRIAAPRGLGHKFRQSCESRSPLLRHVPCRDRGISVLERWD